MAARSMSSSSRPLFDLNEPPPESPPCSFSRAAEEHATVTLYVPEMPRRRCFEDVEQPSYGRPACSPGHSLKDAMKAPPSSPAYDPDKPLISRLAIDLGVAPAPRTPPSSPPCADEERLPSPPSPAPYLPIIDLDAPLSPLDDSDESPPPSPQGTAEQSFSSSIYKPKAPEFSTPSYSPTDPLLFPCRDATSRPWILTASYRPTTPTTSSPDREKTTLASASRMQPPGASTSTSHVRAKGAYTKTTPHEAGSRQTASASSRHRERGRTVHPAPAMPKRRTRRRRRQRGQDPCDHHAAPNPIQQDYLSVRRQDRHPPFDQVSVRHGGLTNQQGGGAWRRSGDAGGDDPDSYNRILRRRIERHCTTGPYQRDAAFDSQPYRAQESGDGFRRRAAPNEHFPVRHWPYDPYAREADHARGRTTHVSTRTKEENQVGYGHWRRHNMQWAPPPREAVRGHGQH